MPRAKKKPIQPTLDGSTATTTTPPPDYGRPIGTKILELHAAAQEALCRANADHAREALTDGAVYQVDLAIAGTINGETYADRCQGQLFVGHKTQASSSSGPEADEILALMLGKLNAKTREKFLREVVEEYQANGNKLPAADPTIYAMAKATLKQMRASETVTKNGPVKFSAAAIALAV